MRKSIFSQIFYICISAITASIILVATVHIFLSLETYHKDRRNELIKYTWNAVQYTQSLIFSGADTGSIEFITSADNYLKNLSKSTGAEFMMADANGRRLAASDNGKYEMLTEVPSGVIGQISEEGTYSYGNYGGFYADTWFIMAYKLEFGNNTYYIFGRLSSQGMHAYMGKLVFFIIITALVILIVAYLLLSYAVMNIVRPIREMTMAAHRFGEGDFSEKIHLSDRNELGYLANSFNEMAYSLERIEENRKSFVSNVSHELKTPMTTIGGFVNGILEGVIPKEEQRHYLKIVSEEIDRLARLVRSMLNISKYESGEIKLQTDNFEASAIIVRTVLLFENRLESKKIEIKGLDDEKFYLNADIDLVQQVIYNLTENAAKFVNEGGYIEFSHEEQGNMTALRIRNSGEGLKESEMLKVFDRFYKTDESRGKDKTGVGLGLSIVRSIVRLHDGTITVRSKPGEYTEFEFTLPTGAPPPKKSTK